MKNDKMTLDALAVLVDGGYSVLEIDNGGAGTDNDPFYMITYRWAPAFTSPVATVDYNVADGADITDWLRRNLATAYNRQDFLGRMDDYLRTAPTVRVEFERSVPWRRWSKAV